jgi:hypothetical protein
VAQPSNPKVFWWTAANPACRLRSWAATLHRLRLTTSSCFSCHHAARTWPRWPPGPSSQAYLSLHSLEAPQGIDLSRPLFTCTNANQAATCTRNTRPRVSPHHVVNHSSQPGATIHRSSDAPVLNIPSPPRVSPSLPLLLHLPLLSLSLNSCPSSLLAATEAQVRTLPRLYSPRALDLRRLPFESPLSSNFHHGSVVGA